MTQKIPFFDLTPEINEHWDEINAAIQRVLRSGQFIMGPEVFELEARLADYVGVRHAITHPLPLTPSRQGRGNKKIRQQYHHMG